MVSWFVAAERAVKEEASIEGSERFSGRRRLRDSSRCCSPATRSLAGPPSTADALRTVAALAAGALALVFGAAAVRASDASRDRLREAPDSPSQT